MGSVRSPFSLQNHVSTLVADDYTCIWTVTFLSRSPDRHCIFLFHFCRLFRQNRSELNRLVARQLDSITMPRSHTVIVSQHAPRPITQQSLRRQEKPPNVKILANLIKNNATDYVEKMHSCLQRWIVRYYNWCWDVFSIFYLGKCSLAATAYLFIPWSKIKFPNVFLTQWKQARS